MRIKHALILSPFYMYHNSREFPIVACKSLLQKQTSKPQMKQNTFQNDTAQDFVVR